jgi:YidC/Oxa1 family membrane protein insertase
MNFFVDLLINLTKIFGGSLGITIIFIGVASRVIFYPFLKSSLKQNQILKELKPKLDSAKKKHGHDKKRHAEEQARIYKEAGFNPAAGCLAPIVQLVVAIILFNALRSLINTKGIETTFLIWDLRSPDILAKSFNLSGIASQLPGVLVILTAIATLVQAKMMLPEPVPFEKNDSLKEVDKKEGVAEALAASQGQFVFLFPLMILFTGRLFPAGLALYWLVSTLVGLVQQYYITGLGGLKPWLKFLQKK